MEFIKKITLISFLLISVNTYLVNAQTFENLVKAFQESYLQEASGDYSKAIESLRSVYKENTYEINLRLGYLCYLSGRFSESLAYYNKSVDLMPFSVEARLGIVLPASAMGNWSQVIKHYEKILDIIPNYSIVMHRLGLIYYGREDYAAAEKYFDKVVNMFPFDYDALTMLAWTKMKLNKTREAKVLFSKALLNTPGGASASEGLELLK
jgi:tetratricopeptide (TPR) repeat protein